MKNLLKWLSLLSLLTLACQSTSSKLTSRAHEDIFLLYRQGINHMDNGHLQEAIQAFRQVVAQEPENAPAWNNLGKAYFLQHQYLEAENCFKRAIQIIPSYADAYNNLGTLYLNTQKYDEAEKAFIQAQQDVLFRQGPVLWHNFGLLYQLKDDCGKAIQYFTEAINRNPVYYMAYAGRAKCFEMIGQNDRAAEDYEKALEIRKNDPQLLMALGKVYIKVARYQDAKTVLNRVSILVPATPMAKEAEELLHTLP